MKTIPDNPPGKHAPHSSFTLVSNNDAIHLPDRHGESLVPTEVETSIGEIADPKKIEPTADLQVVGVASTENNMTYSREPEEFDDSEAGDDEDTLEPITK